MKTTSQRLEKKYISRGYIFIFSAALTSIGAHVISLYRNGRMIGVAGSTGSIIKDETFDGNNNFFRLVYLIILSLLLLQSVTDKEAKPVGMHKSVLVLFLAVAAVNYFVTGAYPSSAFVAIFLTSVIAAYIGGTIISYVATRVAVIFILLNAVVALVDSSHAWTVGGDLSKALIGDKLLAGFLPQMNVLGMTIALLLCFTGRLRRKWFKIFIFLIGVTLLVLSASRSSIIALGVGIIVAVCLRMFRNKPRLQKALYSSLVLIILALGWIVPNSVNSDDAFTGRGKIWRAVMEGISSDWLLGKGLEAFSNENFFGEELQNVPHAHNLILEFLATGGITGLLLLGVIVFLASKSAIKYMQSGDIAPAVFVIILLTIGISESPIRLDEFDGVSFISWTMLLSLVFSSPNQIRSLDKVSISQRGMSESLRVLHV